MYKILNILKWSFNWNVLCTQSLRLYNLIFLICYNKRSGGHSCTERLRIDIQKRGERNRSLKRLPLTKQGRKQAFSWIESNPWLTLHNSREIRIRSHTLVWEQGQNWVLFLEGEGHRFTKVERAEEHAVVSVGTKAQVDLLCSTSDSSTVCASDGSEMDRCLVDNYFKKIFIRTKGKQDLGRLT